MKKLINLTSYPLFLVLFFSLSTRQVFAADVAVTVNPNQKTITVPASFLGLSIPKSALCDLIKADRQSAVLTNLLKNLAPAVMNLAAKDGVGWDTTKQECSGNTITPVYADAAIALAKKVNWKFLWGINLTNNTPQNISAEGVYILNHAGSQLWELQLGQEPEFTYGQTEADYQKFKTDWVNGVNAIAAQSPAFFFSGPESDGIHFNKFLDDEHSRIVLATHDDYAIGTSNNSNPGDAATKISLMLKPVNTALFDTLVAKAKSYNLPLSLNGVNSISGGGTKGASDTFASTLWATDYLFTTLEHGVVNVDFHGVPTAQSGSLYAPIYNASSTAGSYSLYAKPEYYAQLLFKYAASNGKVTPVQLNTSFNVSAHAIVNTDDTLRVVVINKENKTVSVVINTTKPYGSANIMRLMAPSLTATITSPTDNTVKLGGNSVAADGTWTPAALPNLDLNGAVSTVFVPSYSVVVVSYFSAGPGLGDLNGDYKIDNSDYKIFLSNFGKTGSPGFVASDFDKNGKVDIFDYNILVANFGK